MAAKESEKITGEKREAEAADRSVERKNTKQKLAALKLHVESEQFLERRREKTKYKEAFDQTVGKVKEALAAAKQKIDDMIDKANPGDIAALTNAWLAWKGGNLERYLAPQYRTARQLWRTEMVAYISGKLAASSRIDKAAVMEVMLAAQTVTEFEDDPAEALKTAMHIDAKIKGLAVRRDIAKKMEKSDFSGGLDSIGRWFRGYTMKEMKVVVGGEFLKIPPEQAANFKFMRMALDEKENRIYAQMENGCRGNLVIIELTPTVAPEGIPQPPAPRQRVPEGTQQPPAPRQRVPEGTQQPPAPRQRVPEGTPQQPAPRAPAEGTPQPGAPRSTTPEGTQQPPAPRQRVPEGTQQPAGPRKALPPERGESDDARPPPEK